MKVLLLDDTPMYLLLFGEIIIDEGHEVVTADDGAYVIKNADVVSTCDVIVTDTRMPTDGIKVLQYLASIGWNKPVLLHSSLDVGPNGEDLLFINKTFPFAQFAVKVPDGSRVVEFLRSNK